MFNVLDISKKSIEIKQLFELKKKGKHKFRRISQVLAQNLGQTDFNLNYDSKTYSVTI